jgi:hypothetical protein
MLFNDNYYLTTMDLWLLVNKYKIPTIFLCQKTILQTNYVKHAFIGYGDREDEFALIIIPAFRPSVLPSLKIVINSGNEIFFKLDKLKDDCNENLIGLFDETVLVENYLENFTITNKQKIVKTPKVKIVMDVEEELEKKPIKRHTKKEKKIQEMISQKLENENLDNEKLENEKLENENALEEFVPEPETIIPEINKKTKKNREKKQTNTKTKKIKIIPST